MLLAGIVLGGFIGQLADGISWLKWMNYGQSFGLDTPLVIDFGLLVITFGLTIKITMASIIGVAVALFIYKMIQKLILKMYLERCVVRRINGKNYNEGSDQRAASL